MRQKTGPQETAEQHVRDIRRATRRKYSTEDKIRVVLSEVRRRPQHQKRTLGQGELQPG